jgi:hypothetical protein
MMIISFTQRSLEIGTNTVVKKLDPRNRVQY